MVERVLDRLLDDALGFGGGEAVLGLALKFRLANEHGEHHGRAHHHVFRGDGGGAFALADAFGVILQAAQSALRMPDSCVPPSCVGIVLQ